WPEVRLQLHAFERPALYREFAEEPGGGRKYAAFSPDGRWLAVSGGERMAVWELTRDGPGAVVNEAWNTRVGFAPDGELFASRPGECFRWRLSPGANAAAPPQLERLDLAQPAGFTSLCLLSNGVVFTCQLGSSFTVYYHL